MNIATIRIEGDDSALELLKREMPFNTDAQWHKGDIRINGRECLSSGFNATIAGAGDPVKLTGLVCSFLLQCKERSLVFSRLGLSAELDVGFTVGDSEQFTGSMRLSPSELLLFADCGITLKVSAYPTSDETNAT